MSLELKETIETTLKNFARSSLRDAGIDFLHALGYESKKTLRLKDNTLTGFTKQFPGAKNLNHGRAMTENWKTIDILFQLTDDEVRQGLRFGQDDMFTSDGQVDDQRIESYLFIAIELKAKDDGTTYSRTDLSRITRALNHQDVFRVPIMLLFRHEEYLSLAVINRRLHKRDAGRDVLEKVTLIKDISFANPLRAHIEILYDLSLQTLYDQHKFKGFVGLHQAWEVTLDIQQLNKRFFIEIRNWFYWARGEVKFPEGAKKDAEGRDSESTIRLLTRLIFCWFLREKGLIPGDLFVPYKVQSLLKNWDPIEVDKDKDGSYYRAILQNLFFATLNTPEHERKFRSERRYKGINKHYGDQRYFRHVALFNEKAPVEELYRQVPFLNGGLFDSLDIIPKKDEPEVAKEVRIDGFSDDRLKQPTVPDFLFFGNDRTAPKVSMILGEKRSTGVRGLFHILHDYKFTVEENTPLEQDIALDPELLGRAFENLLAEVNPETGTVARKSTGSFYTPREIVNYMVEECLVRHFLTVLDGANNPSKVTEDRLRTLVSEMKESHELGEDQIVRLVSAIGNMRILDMACGSGAYPMGILQRLVHVLHKLDPGNARWKSEKLKDLPEEMRQKAEEVFNTETFEYTRKLELIKDCIHGVDIQPMAIQIAKLRFFLSLVIEQEKGRQIRPLPNLETKFVCANALIPLPKRETNDMFEQALAEAEKKLLRVRHRYFFAATHDEKEECKKEDRERRREVANLIKSIGEGVSEKTANDIESWDPYKPDRAAKFFDPETMFGVRDGFDITIGNPPYVRADEQSDWNQEQRLAILETKYYETLWEKWDLFVPFIERSYKLLRKGGISSLIVSDGFCHAKYAQKPQNWFLANARVLRIDFCKDIEIFDAAVRNMIYFFQRAFGATQKPQRRVHKERFGDVAHLATTNQTDLTYRAFFPEDNTFVLSEEGTVTLSEICYISVGMVAHADEKVAKGEFKLEDLVSASKDSKHPVPFVEGKYLNRWLPASHRWLEWGTNRSPRLLRRSTFEEMYKVPCKLISVDMSAGSDQLRVAYDDGKLFHNHSAWSFVPWVYLSGVRNRSLKKTARYPDETPRRADLLDRARLEELSKKFGIKYLLGVMNSSVARDFLRANRRSNIHLYPDDWKKLPIPDVSPEKQKPIVSLVDQILDLRRQDPKADVTGLEKQIDDLVKNLYGIEEGENGIVSSTPASLRDSSAKDVLRDKVLPQLKKAAPYFHIDQIREAMKKNKVQLEDTVLNGYLVELVEAGFIFDAGREWYSFLDDEPSLDPDPIKQLLKVLSDFFPLLDVGVWSTSQLNPWMHHLIGQGTLVLNTDKDVLEDVALVLEDEDWKPVLNPRKDAVKRFSPGPKTVLIRAQHSGAPEPIDSHARVEQILVDLAFELSKKGLPLMSKGEFLAMTSRLAMERRLNMGTLLNYARKRRLVVSDIFSDQLAILFEKFASNWSEDR